jgi:hypothetical protein
MTRQTTMRLRSCVLGTMMSLALSMLMCAPLALAQEDPFALDLTITGATLDKSGFVTVTVTVACTDPSQIFGGCASVTQPVGRKNYVIGFACVRETGQCDLMAPYVFSVEIFPSGRFVPETP